MIKWAIGMSGFRVFVCRVSLQLDGSMALVNKYTWLLALDRGHAAGISGSTKVRDLGDPPWLQRVPGVVFIFTSNLVVLLVKWTLYVRSENQKMYPLKGIQ